MGREAAPVTDHPTDEGGPCEEGHSTDEERRRFRFRWPWSWLCERRKILAQAEKALRIELAQNRANIQRSREVLAEVRTASRGGQ